MSIHVLCHKLVSHLKMLPAGSIIEHGYKFVLSVISRVNLDQSSVMQNFPVFNYHSDWQIHQIWHKRVIWEYILTTS